MESGIVVSEFEFKSRFCIHFQTNTLGKRMKTPILPDIGKIIPQLVFYNSNFGIK